jgi:hypothetical protein
MTNLVGFGLGNGFLPKFGTFGAFFYTYTPYIRVYIYDIVKAVVYSLM